MSIDHDPSGHETTGWAMLDDGLLHQLLAEFSTFGGLPNGGVHRLTASAEDGAARDHLRVWLLGEGAEVRVDRAGNMFGLFDLAGPGAPIVMCGSHLDTQPNGGKLDGALGVAAACCTARSLLFLKRDGHAFEANFCVVNWTNEEGARFRPSLLGSGSYVGAIALDAALAAADDDGVTAGEALAAIGYLGQDEPPPLPAAYLELHVEQDVRLEENGAQIGIVVRNWGAAKLDVVFTGEQTHTGPGSMARRRDALLGAAHAVTAIRALADRWPGALHTSVARMLLSPNSPNTVAARVEMSVEIRSADDAILSAAHEAANVLLQEAAEAAGIACAIASETRRGIRMLPGEIADLTRTCAREAGYVAMDVDTVAGHDALSFLGRCPTGLIFVPSVDGIAHNPREETAAADLAAGLDTLTRAAFALCSGDRKA
jgi:beta-ureidopropionase / N-carbamoyl-L-amino-acid hydrolase